jgi:methyl-accepting chemotaxis protein
MAHPKPVEEHSRGTSGRGHALGTVAKILSVIALVALTTLAVGAVGVYSIRTVADLNTATSERDVDGITKASVQTVAAGTEEMTASIREIAKNAERRGGGRGECGAGG